jgi:hypothetical protein
MALITTITIYYIRILDEKWGRSYFFLTRKLPLKPSWLEKIGPSPFCTSPFCILIPPITLPLRPNKLLMRKHDFAGFAKFPLPRRERIEERGHDESYTTFLDFS